MPFPREVGSLSQAEAFELGLVRSTLAERTDDGACLELEVSRDAADGRSLAADLFCVETLNGAMRHLFQASRAVLAVHRSWQEREDEATDQTLDYCEDLPGDLRALDDLTQRLYEFGTGLIEQCDRARATSSAADNARPSLSLGAKPDSAAPPAGAALPLNKTNNQRQRQDEEDKERTGHRGVWPHETRTEGTL